MGDGEVMLGYLPDAVNFVDCFTKWVDGKKFEASLAYLSGGAAGKAATIAVALREAEIAGAISAADCEWAVAAIEAFEADMMAMS